MTYDIIGLCQDFHKLIYESDLSKS